MIKDFAVCHFFYVLQVMIADDQYRRKIQLAAVVTGNFSNHLFTLAADYCKQEAIDFSLLLPLLKEQLQDCKIISWKKCKLVLQKEMTMEPLIIIIQMLENYPEIKKIYTLITASIHGTLSIKLQINLHECVEKFVPVNTSFLIWMVCSLTGIIDNAGWGMD